MTDSFTEKVYLILHQIPQGKVATYGQVAQLAGFSKQARQVGQLLHHLPSDTRLPWHRVINSQGKISLPINHPAFNEQCARLKNEGLAVVNGRISLTQFQWQP